MAAGGGSVVVVIRAMKPNSSDGGLLPRNTNREILPRFSFTKPSWIVKTESNVWKEERKKPRPSCLLCGGSGRVDCHHCQGKGRTNCADLAMLPKGEWPKWCRTCGGSGLGYCNRCMGSGEYRDIIGFNFMNGAKRGGLQEKKF